MKGKTVLILGIIWVVGLCGCTIPGFESKPIENHNTTVGVYESVEPEVSAPETEPVVEIKAEPEDDVDLNADNTDPGRIKEQLALIENYYDTFCEEFPEEMMYDGYMGYIAVTDFNRNGRLELFASTCQGSGAFSTSLMYEVSEDYSSLERMSAGDSFFDICGDFTIFEEVECYKKEGTYYYVFEDYCSSGWDYKGTFFYAYSFDNAIQSTPIGGFLLYGKGITEEDIRYVNLFDSEDNMFDSEEDYFAYMKDFWKDYERQPNCRISWREMRGKEDFLAELQMSYNEFSTELPPKDTNYDYKLLEDPSGHRVCRTGGRTFRYYFVNRRSSSRDQPCLRVSGESAAYRLVPSFHP